MFRDETIVVAIIDRLFHRADFHALTGNSYRTGERNLDTMLRKKSKNNRISVLFYKTDTGPLFEER